MSKCWGAVFVPRPFVRVFAAFGCSWRGWQCNWNSFTQEVCNISQIFCVYAAAEVLSKVSIGVLSFSGVASADRITNGQLYAVVYKEMLASAFPGRLHEQVPRMLISMIAALENRGRRCGFSPVSQDIFVVAFGPKLVRKVLQRSQRSSALTRSAPGRLLLGEYHTVKNNWSRQRSSIQTCGDRRYMLPDRDSRLAAARFDLG